MSIGLALSGGGAKGMAHIGVIKALEKNGIKIDYISGCSSGSIIAALYASGYSADEIYNIVMKNKKRIIDYDNNVGFKLLNTAITKKLSIKGFVKGDRLEAIIKEYLDFKNISNISDVKFPLAIPTVNLNTGEIVYFTNSDKIDMKDFCQSIESKNTLYTSTDIIGSYGDIPFDDFPTCIKTGELSKIVRASCSFPGVFVPKQIEDNVFVDGGVRVNTPVEILKKMGADKVIAVTFNCNMTNSDIKNIVGISEQAFNVLTHNSNFSEQDMADVNIRLCINNVSLLDFSKTSYLVNRGYNIVINNINKIQELLQK